MPTYELVAILRQFQRPEMFTTLKRVSRTLWDQRAIIRDVQFMGERELPVRMKRDGENHSLL